MKSDDLKHHILDASQPYVANFGGKVGLHLKVQYHRFNKFRVVRVLMNHMSAYDHVLLVDSDLLFAGYPWAELFRRANLANSVVISTACESKSEGLIRNAHSGVRQWFRDFDGS